MPLKALANTEGNIVLPLTSMEDATISAKYSCNDITRKIFSLGRGVGASYYHLIDLCDQSREKPFKELEDEYNNAFQNLNIIDIILNDIGIGGKIRYDLNIIRKNFYNALRDQDLSETKLAFARDMFVVFYENLSQDINRTYSCKGSWLLSLGFYASFQLESLNSSKESKILLSGFQKIMSRRTVAVPQYIYDNLTDIYKLDKIYITQADLINLERNLTTVIGYFTTYPESMPLFNEIKDLTGNWQGILFNPNNERYDIRLIVNDDLTASMDIYGIARNVIISDIRVVNNYFTFMFKPFGTEKLYMRFNAKLSENIFTGEIIDVLGEKGYWVLASTDEEHKLSDVKLNTMISYIEKIEEKLKNPKKPLVLATTEVEKLVAQKTKSENEQVEQKICENKLSPKTPFISGDQTIEEKLLSESANCIIVQPEIIKNLEIAKETEPEEIIPANLKIAEKLSEKPELPKKIKSSKLPKSPEFPKFPKLPELPELSENIVSESWIIPVQNITPAQEVVSEEATPAALPEQQKVFLKKLKSLLKRLFSFMNFV